MVMLGLVGVTGSRCCGSGTKDAVKSNGIIGFRAL
jgi:hypothetical protein